MSEWSVHEVCMVQVGCMVTFAGRLSSVESSVDGADARGRSPMRSNVKFGMFA